MCSARCFVTTAARREAGKAGAAEEFRAASKPSPSACRKRARRAKRSRVREHRTLAHPAKSRATTRVLTANGAFRATAVTLGYLDRPAIERPRRKWDGNAAATSTRVALGGRGRDCGADLADRRRGGLSDPPGAHHRGLGRRQHAEFDFAPDRAMAVGASRPALCRGKPDRRRRQYCYGSGGERCAGWLLSLLDR